MQVADLRPEFGQTHVVKPPAEAQHIPDGCPACGLAMDAHARGAVDFYCPTPPEAKYGN